MQFEDDTYMGMALLAAKNSYAKRRQVGCVIVATTGAVIPSWNGTPSGMDNQCEEEVEAHKFIGSGRIDAIQVEKELKTLPTVIHAELGALLKMCKNKISSDGAIAYITLAPCFQCSIMLAQAGIKEVVYLNEYRDMSGVNFLQSYGVQVRKYNGDKSE